MIVGATQSAIWIRNQLDSSSATAYYFLVQTSVIWASQQLINLIFLPMLNLRKFNGKAAAVTVTRHIAQFTRPLRLLTHAAYVYSHMLHATFATGRPCAHGRFRPSPYYRFCGAPLSVFLHFLRCCS